MTAYKFTSMAIEHAHLEALAEERKRAVVCPTCKGTGIAYERDRSDGHIYKTLCSCTGGKQ